MEEMKYCSNCGAPINIHTDKCPHCGYTNIEGAEEKYLNELEEIKDNLAQVEKEPAKALKKGLSKGAKVLLCTVGILIAIAAVYTIILLVELRNSPKFNLSPEEEAYASAYKVLAGEELEEAYVNRDIPRLAEIFDKAYSEDRVSLWGDPHYETGYAASCYMKLQQCLEDLDRGKLKKREAEDMTYYCFYFYYRSYGDDGAVIFDEIRDEEILPILGDRLGYTIEDMEALRAEVTDPPYVVRSKIHKVSKNHYKNFH